MFVVYSVRNHQTHVVPFSCVFLEHPEPNNKKRTTKMAEPALNAKEQEASKNTNKELTIRPNEEALNASEMVAPSRKEDNTLTPNQTREDTGADQNKDEPSMSEEKQKSQDSKEEVQNDSDNKDDLDADKNNQGLELNEKDNPPNGNSVAQQQGTGENLTNGDVDGSQNKEEGSSTKTDRSSNGHMVNGNSDEGKDITTEINDVLEGENEVPKDDNQDREAANEDGGGVETQSNRDKDIQQSIAAESEIPSSTNQTSTDNSQHNEEETGPPLQNLKQPYENINESNVPATNIEAIDETIDHTENLDNQVEDTTFANHKNDEDDDISVQNVPTSHPEAKLIDGGLTDEQIDNSYSKQEHLTNESIPETDSASNVSETVNATSESQNNLSSEASGSKVEAENEEVDRGLVEKDTNAKDGEVNFWSGHEDGTSHMSLLNTDEQNDSGAVNDQNDLSTLPPNDQKDSSTLPPNDKKDSTVTASILDSSEQASSSPTAADLLQNDQALQDMLKDDEDDEDDEDGLLKSRNTSKDSDSQKLLNKDNEASMKSRTASTGSRSQEMLLQSKVNGESLSNKSRNTSKNSLDVLDFDNDEDIANDLLTNELLNKDIASANRNEPNVEALAYESGKFVAFT